MELTTALRDFDPRLLTVPEGRRALSQNDPLMFAAIYMPHHLKDSEKSSITLCDFHTDLIGYARTLTADSGSMSPKANRDCFIAPRQSGKSTWIFTIIPMWAAAHGHKKFIAAFSDSETQAENHLFTFKQELMNNELLREDFPELCASKEGQSNAGRALMNNRNQIMQSNGFIFMAKGADSAALGMKVGALRPDLLLFDDIEKGESNYGPTEIRKRKETLISDLFYLNTWAHVAIVGTTTMPHSIMDQIRKVHDAKSIYDGPEDLFRDSLDADLRWVVDENITTHYWPVVLQENDGTEFSLWPERWSMEVLNEQRHTRDFAKNMMNRPVSLDGGYWDDEDIDIDWLEEYGNTIISVDPAVTTAARSDYTGLAVLSRGNDGKIYVRHAEGVKLNSESLRAKVNELIQEYKPGLVYVETNQGGDLWKQVFAGIPCKYRSVRQREKKEVRAAQAHDFYKKNMVKHVRHFPSLEEQMLAFPSVPHDDILDAVVSGVLYFKAKKGGPLAVKQFNYMEAR